MKNKIKDMGERFDDIVKTHESIREKEKGLWMLAITHLNKAERESVLATYERLHKIQK